MSKTETIEALLESAIHRFAKDGYEGASLRDIARHAGVPLSTIHFYFGSKNELYAEVRRQAWNEIDDERTAYLEKALSAHPGRPPAFSALIHALAYPVVRRALSKNQRDIGQIYIIRSITSVWRSGAYGQALEMADRSMARWIDAIAMLYPTLSRGDVIWTFSFIVGAIYSWQIVAQRYDSMLGPERDRSPEDVTSDIVAFCCTGFEAVVERRMPLSNVVQLSPVLRSV